MATIDKTFTRLCTSVVAYVDCVEAWGRDDKRTLAAYERLRAVVRDLEVPEDRAEEVNDVVPPRDDRPSLHVLDGGLD